MSNSLFRKKPIEQMLQESNSKAMKRTLGAFDLTSLGIGAIIGTGIFVLTGIVSAENAGPAIILSFVFAAIACGFAALCYAEFASTVPIAGSVYTYSYATLGELVAFMIGWDLMLEYLLAVSAVSTGWSSYFQSLLAGFGMTLPTALSTSFAVGDGGFINLPAFVIVLLITTLLSAGIRESARINNVIVLIKIAVVLLFIFVGFGYVKPENWTPFTPFGYGGIMTGAATVFFAYLGFDAVSTAAEETKRPQRDLPIGIIASLLICTALYIIVSLILTGIVPYTELNVNDPVAFALQFIGQDSIAGIVSVGAIAGMTTVLLVMLYGQTRILYSMSRDGLLPSKFAKVNKKTQTPRFNTWFTGLIAATIGGFVDLGTLSTLVNIGTLSAFILVSIGVIVLRKTRPDLPRAFKVPFMPVIPILAILFCGYLMLNLPAITWISFGIWLLIGSVVYFGYARKRSHLHEQINDEVAATSISFDGQ